MLRKISISIALLLAGVLFLFPVLNSVKAAPALSVDQGRIPVTADVVSTTPVPEGENQVHALYFYANDCSHCKAVYEGVLTPLMEKYGDQLDLRMLETGIPENYELLIAVESYFKIKSEERGLPVIVIGEQILIGEDAARTELPSLVEKGINGGGVAWPAITDLNPEILQHSTPDFSNSDECSLTNPSACETGQPIYAAYFYQVGCQACSRVDADLKYLRSKYPNLIIEEFNIYDHAALADWMSAKAGRDDFHTPALFIGKQAWIGEEEITPDALLPVLKSLNDTGSKNYWKGFDEDKLTNSIVNRFRSMGWMAVVFAGLVDGLNPCAFATIIFFVSYLTISGRKGREILMVGGAFSIGVFLAYLAVGLGLYKVLDLFGNWLGAVGRWVYALTAVFCLVLAIFNLRDFFKARKGHIEDMELNLPKPLRMRINATIREGRKARAYVIGAFFTGVLVSLLELACTGQIYLPTIIFVSSIPELRVQALFFLILYNLLFIVPLIVVFILAYFGTTSKDLTTFLQKHTAAVKMGMVILFLGLAIWLGVSLLS
jgi:cytochrome c biogenesis protein CcdA/thiol-disulfide isomerase/thioredoxin